jgi:hypothetical protein
VVVVFIEGISKIPVFKDTQVTGDLEWSASQLRGRRTRIIIYLE